MHTNASILVVEDEHIVAKDVEFSLKRLGYSVPAMVGTGEEAVQKAEALRPDLVLMDIRLDGDMDGIEAARRIQRYQCVPVVYLSAYADDATLSRALETDSYGYLLKPFRDYQLRLTIQMALQRHHARHEQASRIEGLEKALQDARALSGLIPICTRCKKIRDERGAWYRLEAYLRSHCNISFTHGYCPECAEMFRTEFLRGGGFSPPPPEDHGSASPQTVRQC